MAQVQAEHYADRYNQSIFLPYSKAGPRKWLRISLFFAIFISLFTSQRMHFRLSILATCLALTFISCKKEPTIVPDNEAPYYGDVPTVLVKNYINRLYIDLLGREPLDVEMDADVLYLREEGLSIDARNELATRLQTDTSWIDGDSSYHIAYHKRLYDMAKARLIEGASNSEINSQIGIYYNGYIKDSINGNLIGMAEKQLAMDKLRAILQSERAYRNDSIDLTEMHARMIDNYFYDFINMNTFNFINATFDDLYFRFPSQAEFNTAFDIIEYNTSSTLFGLPAQNKDDYIRVVTQTREFYEGLIIWAYQTLLSRNPETDETVQLMQEFYIDQDFQKIQRHIVSSDEYANFK